MLFVNELVFTAVANHYCLDLFEVLTITTIEYRCRQQLHHTHHPPITAVIYHHISSDGDAIGVREDDD